jgi:hypothetical protein
MIIEGPFTNGINDEQIKEFLGESLKSLGEEFKLLFKKTEWAKDCLFEYNERALVGLLNNAIVRQGKQYRTIQEYHVYRREDQLIGRADLLVMHEDFDFLIEAKKWGYDGRDDYDMCELIREPKNQLLAYYKAEKQYFKEERTFLGIVIFEYVAGGKDNEKIKQAYRSEEDFEEGINFDVFYGSEKGGLMVYGHVFRATDLKHGGSWKSKKGDRLL